MRFPRFTAGVLAIAAVALFAIAVYDTSQKYRAVLLWKPVEATVVENGLGFNHDGEGRLRFFARAVLRYSTPSGEHKTRADSEFGSLRFAQVRSRIENISPGRKITAYYDPARHGNVRFGSEYSLDYLGRAAYYYAGAALAALAAAAILVFRKPDRNCGACHKKLSQNYRYCPFCGAPAAASLHLISNGRPVAI